MAELCTAFKRIVPRYQFSTNQAVFFVEDMHDAPKRCSCNKVHYNRSYVHHKCNLSQNISMCTSMDTCGNIQDKMHYH